MSGERSSPAWPGSLRPQALRSDLNKLVPSPPSERSGARRKRGSFIADRRGAVALETLIVYIFLIGVLVAPLADMAAAGFQFISAWGALRGFGQYVQYKPPPDPTSIATWKSGLTTTMVGGYAIGNIQVKCGDTNTTCTSTNVGSIPKYYSYTTSLTLAPLVLRRFLCTSGNTNPCSFTLPYTERFQ